MLYKTILAYIFYFFFISLSISNDIREFAVGSDIREVSNQRYTNIVCLEDKKKIKYWKNFKRCKKQNDNLYYINFEYNDNYAFNENYEGTLVAGHPVKLNLGINIDGKISRIDVNTDPNAPFYFKKQAHLFWMRINSKYGSKDWECVNFEKEPNHLIINKKYINKTCTKEIGSKTIMYHTEFYFVDERKKQNLVSRTKMSIIKFGS